MANGNFGGGDGTSSSPYLIEDVDDLINIKKHPTSYFKLVSNINLGVYPYNEYRGWTPIKDFSGRLDGNNKKIVNLYINDPDGSELGLFGRINLDDSNKSMRFQVSNLTMENVDIRGKNSCGAVAGSVDFNLATDRNTYEAAFFNNVAVSGKISAYGTHIGGITGAIQNTDDSGEKTFIIAYNCLSRINVNLMQPTCTYISQLVGVSLYGNNLYTSNVISNKYVYENCVGCGTLTKNAFNPSFVGGISLQSYCSKGNLTINSYVNKSVWNSSWNYNNPTSLTSEEMKKKESFSLLGDCLNDDGFPIWTISNGKYPELYHESSDYMFIFNGSYVIYEPTGDKWVKISDEDPTQQMAQKYGMKNLSYIPSSAWKKLENSSDAYIFNVCDKFGATTQETTEDVFIAGEIKENTKIFRAKISMERFDGSLSSVCR